MEAWMRSIDLKMSGISRSLKNGFLRCSKWGWLVFLVIAMMATFCAQAQLSGKGTITGTVADKTGAVIPGASVAATNEATGITTTTTTTSTGNYNFPNLDAGIYSVTTTAKGFEKLTQKGIHVNALEAQAYNPVLTIGATTEAITVTTALPQLETSNAALGSTMENDVYSELPIEMNAYGQADQRRATDFVYLMPGVQGNETNGNATTNVGVVNGSGSRGAVSGVYIDGVIFVRAGGNGDPRYVWTAMSVDAIDQFQVQTVGYSAIYEGQGVMNYTVKQGGSKQHGSVYEFIRNTEFDTWGFLAKAPNPATGIPVKPVEHNNEYGINLSGPLVPLGKWKEKVFYYGNYNGFRYTSATPTSMTFPTTSGGTSNLGMVGGDFSPFLTLTSGATTLYDPSSQYACTQNSTDGFCRYAYGQSAGTSAGPHGNPTGTATNIIPSTEFSPIAKAMQAFLPTSGITTALSGNYISPNATGLVNWSTTDRIDFLPTSSDTLTFLFADGRQASSNPVGQSTAGRNVGPLPYNYGQTYAPKTAVGIIEETHVFTPHLINQFKWGYARYNGPTFNPNQAPKFAATTMGMSYAGVTSSSGTAAVAGQALQTFPIVVFAGTDAPTQWGGTTANVTLAENYTAIDNLQWTVGKHSFTYGGQVAWMLYNTISATGGTTPFEFSTANSETASIVRGSYSAVSGTGLGYASFLLGQIDSVGGKYLDYSLHPEYGARFRAISPYIQDNWKVNSKLTLDLGLRYDYYPSVREVKDMASYFDPNLANPITGLNGALNFTGHGAGTCNCDTPVKSYFRNIAPRFGMAYQINPKTVIRSSWGVMYTHGDAVGGLASTMGTLGFSASPSFASANDFTTMLGLLNGNDTAQLTNTAISSTTGWVAGQIPSYAGATGVSAGPAYGTGYTKTTGYTGSPSSFTYDDPYIGGRAPEYINWSLGIQRQVTSAMAFTVSYVGSEGHFLQADSNTGRGFQSNALDPKYLLMVPYSHLADTGGSAGAVGTDCTTYNLGCNSTALAGFATNQPLSTLLKPYPFQSVSDSFGYISNSDYHALQAMVNMRTWRGLTVNANYSYSRIIDDGGTFRTGYAIPAGTLANNPSKSWPVDRIERTVSTSNQKHHFVLTTVWDWPLGKTILNSNTYERAILGGFKFSGVFQDFSGSPLVITESSAQTNPAQSSTAPPIMNPNFVGQSARQNGKWGKGINTSNYNTYSFIVPSTGTSTANAAGPFMNPVSGILSSYNYMFSDAPRTAPYNLIGPGNYQLDLAMVRSFPLHHLTQASKLNFRAEWYNVTNHVYWAVASTAVGNSAFGTVTPSSSFNRKAAQFAARIEF
jgi:hypothetical protein